MSAHLFTIVGAPGSGKSTVLDRIVELRPGATVEYEVPERYPFLSAPDHFLNQLDFVLHKAHVEAEHVRGGLPVDIVEMDWRHCHSVWTDVLVSSELITTQQSSMLDQIVAHLRASSLLPKRTPFVIDVSDRDLRQRILARGREYEITSGYLEFAMQINHTVASLPVGRRLSGSAEEMAAHICRTLDVRRDSRT